MAELSQDVGCSRPRRLLRLLLTFLQQKSNTALDFEGKLGGLSKLRIPPNPNIVYFGAEAGWEAAILQALFGREGKVVLINQDPMAYQRFLHAPRSVRVRAPRGSKEPWVIVELDPAAMQYIRNAFFEFQTNTKFDVGIDRGFFEHSAGLWMRGRFHEPREELKSPEFTLSHCDVLEMRVDRRSILSMMDWAVAAQMSGFALALWPAVKALIVFTRSVTLWNEPRLIARWLSNPKQRST